MRRMRIIISGEVQGVGFRYFVKAIAQNAGLTGFVRNMDDGRVEVVAQGDDAQLDLIIAACKKGPRHARVEKVEVSYDQASEAFNGFSIE